MVVKEIGWTQDRDVLKWGHDSEVLIARDDAIRFSHECGLQQLVIVRVPASELGACDRHPRRNSFELGEEDGSALSADMGIELG